MMKIHTTMLLAILSLTACTNLVNAMSTEELIFEKSPYVDAAKAVGRQGDLHILERLVKQGLDVNHEGRETKTPWAPAGGDTVTLLLWATLSENFRAAETLLNAGADPNKATRWGMTPLIIASANRNDDLFNLLLMRYKADTNKIYGDSYNETALTVALQEEKKLGEKRFERAKLLIKHGADVNLDMGRGDTAVIRFSRQGYWRNVFWLLENGADYEARDSVNATMTCSVRRSYRVSPTPKISDEGFTYRDKVRDWLLAHGVARSRVDPALHPNTKCDD